MMSITMLSLLLSAFAEETVQVHGRLMDIMHQGKIDTVVSLDSYTETKHTYGLGAVSQRWWDFGPGLNSLCFSWA